MINLVSEIISHDDIDALAEWLKTYPRLTKGPLTKEFEEKFARKVGRGYAVFVNSGSSANLLMAAAGLEVVEEEKRRSYSNQKRKVIVPAVAWSTTVAPYIQLGCDIILCDMDMDTLCINTEHLEKLCNRPHKPEILMIANILGFLPNYTEVKRICDKYSITILEDTCETMGSVGYDGKEAGGNGLMSTFSFYFGHHISTIEGGMITTDSLRIYNKLLMLRSHGWDRDLDKNSQRLTRSKFNTASDFKSLYTFYVPGFNVRSTDLQAFIGLRQIDKLDDIHVKRNANFNTYQKYLKNNFWKPDPKYNCGVVSNFAYPVIHPESDKIVEVLKTNSIECRPLVCGSLANQPFIRGLTDYYSCSGFQGDVYLPNAELCDKYGLYVPNHVDLTEDQIKHICNIINGVTA